MSHRWTPDPSRLTTAPMPLTNLLPYQLLVQGIPPAKSSLLAGRGGRHQLPCEGHRSPAPAPILITVVKSEPSEPFSFMPVLTQAWASSKEGPPENLAPTTIPPHIPRHRR